MTIKTSYLYSFLICTTLSSNVDAETMPCFTPQEKCLRVILKEISSAKKRIWLQGYTFTSIPIERALIQARDKGLDVQVILDKSQATQKHSRASSLQENSITVYIDGIPAIAHSKIIIADDTIITGSYNWTNSAEKRNCENLLIIKDEKETMNKYEDNFLSRKRKATVYDSHSVLNKGK